jgi:hypothetical protein
MSQPTGYTCPRCRAPIALGQQVCSNCGLPLDPASVAAFQASQQTQHVQVAATPPSPRRTSRVPLILGSLVFLLVLCGVIAALSNSGRTNQAVPTGTAPLESAIVATNTALPPVTLATNTAAVPTDTAAPAAPPTNTSPPAPPTAVPPTDVPPTAAPTRKPPIPGSDPEAARAYRPRHNEDQALYPSGRQLHR